MILRELAMNEEANDFTEGGIKIMSLRAKSDLILELLEPLSRSLSHQPGTRSKRSSDKNRQAVQLNEKHIDELGVPHPKERDVEGNSTKKESKKWT